MKRSILAGMVAVLLVALFVGGYARAGDAKAPPVATATTQPALGYPVIDHEKVVVWITPRSLTEINYELGATWEHVSEMLDDPNWDNKALNKDLEKIYELIQERDQMEARTYAKLSKRLKERGELLSRRIRESLGKK